jgi:hypothetical protein
VIQVSGNHKINKNNQNIHSSMEYRDFLPALYVMHGDLEINDTSMKCNPAKY